jgi:hypothetical protein
MVYGSKVKNHLNHANSLSIHKNNKIPLTVPNK